MNVRHAVLGAWIAALPFAVDLPGPPDSSNTHPLRVEVAGGGGQFAVVSRGCDGTVRRVTRNQLLSGALVVEQRLPRDFVIGVRAGNVRTTLHTVVPLPPGPPDYAYRDTTLTGRLGNSYVNPYLGYEGGWVGLGVGAMMARRPLLFGEDDYHETRTTWHVRLGGERTRLTLRWMEDVPLESEGHLSADLALRPDRRFEGGVFAGLGGPYDGMMLGLRGRVWITPEAALQIKASASGSREYGEYGVYGSVIATLPGAR